MANESKHVSDVGSVAVSQGLQLRRTENFVSRYANNIQLESTAFDMKLVFGILDLSSAVPEKIAVEQHTAMSISWPEVKLLIFFLRMHLGGYEAENGIVKVPLDALPPPPPDEIPEQYDNPRGRRAFDIIRKIRAEFMSELTQPKSE
jgi:hypothetical protein